MEKFYVTMGQVHTHSINGKTIDKDCVVEIQAEKYYEEIPNMSFYSRGVINLYD